MLGEAAASRTVDVDNGVLHVASAGIGIDVVMLHGWTLDHRCWSPQLPLRTRVRLVMPDRRGFGQSTAPANLAHEWRDIDALAGAERFVLVGLSQGASVALDYARHRPERLAALVLIGAPLHGVVPNEGGESAIPRLRYAGMVREGQLASVKAEWAKSPLVRTKATGWSLMRAMLDDYDGRDLLAPPTQITFDAADIEALAMPVMAIAGVRDTPWRRRVSVFIGEAAPQGHAISLDDAGHLCNLDQPARFNAILSDFVAPLLH